MRFLVLEDEKGGPRNVRKGRAPDGTVYWSRTLVNIWNPRVPFIVTRKA